MDRENCRYRLAFHLMPKDGWLNDPNGLCYYKGKYHVFFQYSPKDPYGKSKYWGHYTSTDMIKWNYEGVAIKSDTKWDKDGAYSGTAYIEDGMMELFYTGNVKEEGDYDYIHAGRGSNVITVKSEDGFNYTHKELLLTNSDYPANYTCHIRDPKVYRENGEYVMLLGARRDDDKGTILRYVSDDKVKWKYSDEITTKEPFGYMWECPDTFVIDGNRYLMCCPQGVRHERYHYQNVYQSGYFPWNDSVRQEEFVEWDMGFEFYAPQTFEVRGRRIMYGWAGMPDIEPEYDNNPSIEEGWQHALTVPRELTVREGKIYQNPVEELDMLRGEILCDEKQEDIYSERNCCQNILDTESDCCQNTLCTDISLEQNHSKNVSEREYVVEADAIDMVVQFDTMTDQKEILLGDKVVADIKDGKNYNIKMSYSNGEFVIQYLNESGRGRSIRYIKMDELNNIRILKDTSLIEIFINDGLYAATMRYYPDNTDVCTIKTVGVSSMRIWKMNQMEVDGFEDRE